jgi:hypothetical protein
MSATQLPQSLVAPDRPKVAADHSRIPELNGIRAIAITLPCSFQVPPNVIQ